MERLLQSPDGEAHPKGSAGKRGSGFLEGDWVKAVREMKC